MARPVAYSIERPSMEYLRFLGPHPVAVGDLAVTGTPGMVFAPTTGPRLPAVVFAPGWLQPVGRYANTLRYLASWGFIAAAPQVGRGPVPSHSGMALDLSRTLAQLAQAKLGGGRVTVDRNRMALVGHGIGGGAAVLAAAQDSSVRAVATVTAAQTSPSAVLAAGEVTVPGLHMVGDKDDMSPAKENGERIARAWAGPVQLRIIKGAKHLSLAEGKHWTTALTGDGDEKDTQRVARLLITAFLLIHLAGQDQLAEELTGKIPGTTLVDLDLDLDPAAQARA